LSYTPIATSVDGSPRQLLVVITDVTDERARQRMERDSQEMARIFQRATSDRAGVQQFFAEAGLLVQQVSQPGPIERDLHVVHTLKGNCRQMGLESVGDLCHEAETVMQDDHRPLDAVFRERIASRWQHLLGLASFAWDDRRPLIEVGEEDLARLVEALRARAPHHDLLALAESWRLEPVSTRLNRLAEKARYTCERLGKPAATVHTDAGGLRLDSDRWAPFWAALVHAVNNALDHGIEDPDKRVERSKPPTGTLWLSASREISDGRSEIVVSVRDDGGGLDWQRLAAQAAAHRLPYATHDDLVEAMYVEGVSTRAQVGAFSGRGVGLTALRQTTQSLGGRIDVRSETGVGTTMRFHFPCSNELTIAA
jgi:chemotaxis protein histidine kinase CheA